MTTSSSLAASVDIQSRESSRTYYNDVYAASEGVSLGWTGNYGTCNEGTINQDFKEKTILRANYYRDMAGVPLVTMDSAFDIDAQKAALMMSRNNDLEHYPPTWWSCFSAAGSNAAGKCNLSLGRQGPDAVDGQMRDPDAANYLCGHRRWILLPQTRRMGSGTVPMVGVYTGATALYVIDGHSFDARPPTREEYVSWPPPGYVPYPVVFGRWSFAYNDADFSGATVTMTETGTPISVTMETLGTISGTEDTLVWRPKGLSDAYEWPNPGADMTYTVKVNNVLIGGSPRSFTYRVVIFDPATTGVSPPAAPSDVKASNGTYTNKVRIEWRASNGAEFYDVWRATVDDPDQAIRVVSSTPLLYAYDASVVPEQLYYFYVRAGNDDGYSDLSAGNSGWGAMAPPEAPTGVKASDGTRTNEVRVRWDEVAGATFYQVWKNSSNHLNSASLFEEIGAQSSSVIDGDVPAGTTNWYWVRAENPGGWGPFSAGDSGFAAPEEEAPPEAPDAMWASDGRYGDNVYVMWQMPVGSKGFHLWRGPMSDVSSATKILTNYYNGAYHDYDVVPGFHYYYWAQAYNDAGTSDYSACDSGYASVALNPPAKPGCVYASRGTYSDRVKVQWCPVAAASGYEVWRNSVDSTSGAARIAKVEPYESTYDDTAVSSSQTNYYFVTATNEYGRSPFSDSSPGWALWLPSAPSNLTATDGTHPDRVVLDWDSDAGAFDIWRNLLATPYTATRIRTNEAALSYIDITITPGREYFYWVTARGSGLTSGFSNGDSGYASASTPPPPWDVNASQGTYTDKVVVTWSSVPSADRYDVWRNTSNNTVGATRIAPNFPSTTWNDLSALQTLGYYYWVRAVSPGNLTSDWSEVAFGYRAGAISEPEIVYARRAWILVGLAITNLTVGRTNYIEYTTTLGDDATWTRRGALLPSQKDSWWVGVMLGRSTSLFYRVVADPTGP